MTAVTIRMSSIMLIDFTGSTATRTNEIGQATDGGDLCTAVRAKSKWDLDLSAVAKCALHKWPSREGLTAIRANIPNAVGRAIKGARLAVNQIGEAVEKRSTLATFDCSGNLQQVDGGGKQANPRRHLLVHLLATLAQSRCYLTALIIGNRLSSASILTAGAARTLLVFLARGVFDASNAESVKLADAAV